MPLRIGLAPFPTTYTGVIGRIAAEVLLFRTFFHSERIFWFIIWPFHIVGLLILLNHLLSFVIGLVKPEIHPLDIPILGTYMYIITFTAWLMIALLLYILIRRLYKPEIRGMSFFGDYLAVFLILGVISSGTYMAFFTEIDREMVLKWAVGIITFKPVSVGNLIFSIHILFAQFLFIYFPFSKLFHPLGQITSRLMTGKEELLHPEGVVVK